MYMQIFKYDKYIPIHNMDTVHKYGHNWATELNLITALENQEL